MNQIHKHFARMRHIFISNLNDNNDSPIGKYAGNSFEPVWRN